MVSMLGNRALFGECMLIQKYIYLLIWTLFVRKYFTILFGISQNAGWQNTLSGIYIST